MPIYFTGGGGTPGGSNTQLQYNASGLFGGISGATSDGTTLTATSPRIVTSILDANGNPLFALTATASAVYGLTLANAALLGTVALNATAPTAAADSVAGTPISVTTRAAVAGLSNAGAAAGGALTLTTGAAARLTSGNANGGNINLVTGAGIGTGVAGQILIPDGVVTAPAIAFASETTLGICRTASTIIRIGSGGTGLGTFFQSGGNIVTNRGGGNITQIVLQADALSGLTLAGGNSGGTQPRVNFSDPTTGTADIGTSRNVAGVLQINSGTQGTLRWFNWAGEARVATQFDKTADTTLANITGLTINVLAGRSVRFEAVLYTTSNIAGGIKAAISGTATATAIVYEAVVFSAGVSIAIGTPRATALDTTVGDVTAVTVGTILITGLITVNAAGTLTVQFAQNASNGAASSVLVGSSLIAYDVP